jgi:hypothetical protein
MEGEYFHHATATLPNPLPNSFLYLRLMLHRPILTRLCSKVTSAPSTVPSSPAGPRPLPAGQELFASFAAGCARICLGAAMDLIELVHDTYLTNTTGGWWWDGLCKPLLCFIPMTGRSAD